MNLALITVTPRDWFHVALGVVETQHIKALGVKL